MANLFESVTCSRCGGTGMYGPLNVMSGKCFKCLGKGEILTKRGAAAQEFLNGMRMRGAEALAVGDKFLLEGIPGYTASKWVEIAAIEVVKEGYVAFTDTKGQVHHYGVGGRGLRKAFTAEENAAMRAEALAYQETLTKAGTPRKRVAA